MSHLVEDILPLGSSILLVEDDRAAASALAQLLRQEGFHVVCASDGLEGLSLLSRLEPDLVVTDLRLPNLSGLELCKFATALGYPVITMSAYGHLGPRAEQAGARVALEKPVDIDECVAQARLAIAG